MALKRNDTLLLLQIFSGIFYFSVVGYKSYQGDQNSDTTKWLETFAITALALSKMLDNHYKIYDIRESLRSKAQNVRDFANRLPNKHKKPNSEIQLHLITHNKVVDKYVDSSHTNLTLLSLLCSTISGIWINNSALSYSSAAIGLICQSHFSFFQLHKYPLSIENLTDKSSRQKIQKDHRANLL